jgi:hypothetical protein
MASVWHQMAQREKYRNKFPFRVTRTPSRDLLVDCAMPLWDTVMIALVIGSTILFCFWARIRATEGDG